VSRPDPMVRGRQLAADGAVRVVGRSPTRVLAQVRSGTDPDRTWRVEFAGWSCSCPAVTTCSHIMAVRTVIGARDLETTRLGKWWETRAGGAP
jgi:hypothetical protein